MAVPMQVTFKGEVTTVTVVGLVDVEGPLLVESGVAAVEFRLC